VYVRSALYINECKHLTSQRDHCDVLLPGLSLSRRLKVDLAGAFINQTCVREVQAMFLKIHLPFGLIPNDHELIVATSDISLELIVGCRVAFLSSGWVV
jgi:hypothetical protein